MINTSKFPTLHMLCLLIAGLIGLSGCASQHKDWKNYNEQIGLLSSSDKLLFSESLQYALEKAPTNTLVPWKNAQGSVSGNVKPLATLKRSSGQFCRIYEASFGNGADIKAIEAAACRNSEGIWDPVNRAKMHG